jgi:ribosome-associated translation inhibitor RaiA
MTIEIEGVSARATLRQVITRKLSAAFDGLRAQPVTVRVWFVDENGPKGGIAIRCGINVDLPRRSPLHVEQRADTARMAFEAALAGLERRVERERGRVRAERRRPKKYYLAKRLLQPDESLDTVTGAPRPARRALHKSA